METLRFTDATRTPQAEVDEKTQALVAKSTAIVAVGQADPKIDIERRVCGKFGPGWVANCLKPLISQMTSPVVLRERRGASFSVDEIQLLLAGSKATLELRKRVAEKMKKDPTFR